MDHDRLVFEIAHEILHIVERHSFDGVGRDYEAWSTIADWVVNARLIRNRIGTPSVVPFYDPVVDPDDDANELYAALMPEKPSPGIDS